MADFQTLYNQIYSQLAAPTVSYSAPSKAQLANEIAAYLRPQYDQAVAARQDQTIENKASIDTDAASRGMGRSTWVTDVKDRAMDAEASDVANLESNYQAALSQAVQEQYNQAVSNKLAVDQFNASNSATAKGQAYQLAYAQNEKANKGKGGNGSIINVNETHVGPNGIITTKIGDRWISDIGLEKGLKDGSIKAKQQKDGTYYFTW